MRDPAKFKSNLRSWISANRERRRATIRAYYASGRGRAISQERKAIWRGASKGERIFVSLVAADQSGLCYLCSDPMGSDVTLDHVVPISRGGAHTRENVAACHSVCNKRKGARSLLRAMLDIHKSSSLEREVRTA